jgi:hypothetical protein
VAYCVANWDSRLSAEHAPTCPLHAYGNHVWKDWPILQHCGGESVRLSVYHAVA